MCAQHLAHRLAKRRCPASKSSKHAPSLISEDVVLLVSSVLLRCRHLRKDKKGASPLLAASDKGNVAGVRFLLDCGAHVNLQAGPGDGTHAVAPFASPLYNACQNGNEEIVQLLLGARAKVHERIRPIFLVLEGSF